MTRQLCQMVSVFLCAPYNYYHVAVHKGLPCYANNMCSVQQEECGFSVSTALTFIVTQADRALCRMIVLLVHTTHARLLQANQNVCYDLKQTTNIHVTPIFKV